MSKSTKVYQNLLSFKNGLMNLGIRGEKWMMEPHCGGMELVGRMFDLQLIL